MEFMSNNKWKLLKLLVLLGTKLRKLERVDITEIQEILQNIKIQAKFKTLI